MKSELRPARLERGQIWWVRLDPTVGAEIKKTRPCVILTVEAVSRARRTVTVLPFSTSAMPRPPLAVALPSAGAQAVAVCDQLRTVDKSRLTRQFGRLSEPDLRAVEDGVRAVLGL